MSILVVLGSASCSTGWSDFGVVESAVWVQLQYGILPKQRGEQQVKLGGAHPTLLPFSLDWGMIKPEQTIEQLTAKCKLITA